MAEEVTVPSASFREVHWAKDKLKRKNESEIVLGYIDRRLAASASARGKRFVLNIDAPWGSGKTFFLQGIKHDLLEKGCVVAELNAWETDNTDDPMVPVLLSIQEGLKSTSAALGLTSEEKYSKTARQIAEHGGKLVLHLGKGALKAAGRRYLADALENLPNFEDGTIASDAAEAAKNALGKTLEETIEKLASTSTKLLEAQLQATREFKVAITESLTQLGTKDQRKSILYVLVDELDRCRPDYAIKLLERVKHIFDVNGLVFIIATDTSQLQHSIKVIYGSEFDSESYLSRFFDRRYHLRQSSYLDLVNDQLRDTGIESKLSMVPGYQEPTRFLSDVAQAMGLSTRELEQCIAKLIDFVLMWPHKALVECAYAWPLIVLLHKDQSVLSPEKVAANSVQGSALIGLLTSISIPFVVHDSNGRLQRSAASLREVFIAFHDVRKMDFNEIQKVFNVERGGLKDWIGDRLSDELQRIHKGSYISGSPPKTVLSGYIQHARSLDGFS